MFVLTYSFHILICTAFVLLIKYKQSMKNINTLIADITDIKIFKNNMDRPTDRAGFIDIIRKYFNLISLAKSNFDAINVVHIIRVTFNNNIIINEYYQ